MFNNIGGKIKSLAAVVAWFGIGFSVIIGIVLIAAAEELFLIGLIVAVLGSISSWIGSFLIYGFGELVENSAIIAQKTNTGFSEIKVSGFNTGEEITNQSTKNNAESLHKWNGKCQMCDTDNVMISAAVIVDDMGTRYRNVCDECYEKYNCKPKK